MGNAFIELLKSNLLGAIAGLSGFRAWLAKLAIRLFIKLLVVASKYVEVRADVKKDLKKYKEVLNDPNSTADDIRNAAPDFLK